MEYGAVYSWNGTQMVPPTGMDSIRLGVPSNPAKFLPDLRANLEGFEVGYGPVLVGDVISIPMMSELYWTLNAMSRTLTGCTWVANPCDGEPDEMNVGEGISDNNYDADHFEQALETAQADYNYYSTSTDPPYTNSVDAYDPGFATRNTVYLAGHYAYLMASGIGDIMPVDVGFFLHSPIWPEQQMTYSIEDPPGSGNYDFYQQDYPGETTWTGADAGLLYDDWVVVGNGCVNIPNAYSVSVGSLPPDCIDPDSIPVPAGATGGAYSPGGIVSGWTVDSWYALLKWTKEYVGATSAGASTPPPPSRARPRRVARVEQPARLLRWVKPSKRCNCRGSTGPRKIR